MAIFFDYNAFTHQPRIEGCCDNIVFSLGQESKFVKSRIDMQALIQYLETRDGLAQEAAKHILAEQRNTEKRTVKPSTAQYFEVRRALDIWAKSTFGSQHRLYFSPSIRAKLAGDARRLDMRDAIVTELDGRDFCFQKSRLWTHAEAILTVMHEALTTEDDDVEQEQCIQRSSSGNDNRNGTIVTPTDAPLPDISQLDILQSATESAHGDHEEAIDNHTVLAGVLAQSTEESPQGSTALLCNFAVPSFFRSLPGYTLPELLVYDLAATRARLSADSAFSFTSNKTHQNVTPTPTTASRAVTPQATVEAQKSIPRKHRQDSQQTAIKVIQRKTASIQKAKEKNALKKSSTHGFKRTKRRTLINDDMTYR